MKKYFGPKQWSETLYYWIMDEEDIEWIKENAEHDIVNKQAGDAEFFQILPPFGVDDKNSYTTFEGWMNTFEDTNLFLIETEEYNFYKKNRI